jgi:3-oxoacyl-[acyl-carrier-protein] synthase-3
MRVEPTVAPARLTDVPASTPGPVRRAAILSVATELPEGRLTSAEIAERLGISEQWILSRTGIHERRRAAPDERLADYSARAGARALSAAGVEATDIDLVIAATMTPDEVTPNTAPLVADLLGTRNAGAFDVGAACTAFLSGLSIAAAQIETRRAERVLLIGADFITRLVNYDDKATAPLFADGVGAAVVGQANGNGRIGPIVLGSDGSGAPAIYAKHEDRQLVMDGQEVFRHAVSRMSEVTEQAIDRAGISLQDIDLFVYHQANARITRAVGERLELDFDRVVDCIAELGNVSAATLPVALSIANEDGRLWPGARVLLCAFGAGFTWGAGVIEWGGAGGG